MWMPNKCLRNQVLEDSETQEAHKAALYRTDKIKGKESPICLPLLCARTVLDTKSVWLHLNTSYCYKKGFSYFCEKRVSFLFTNESQSGKTLKQNPQSQSATEVGPQPRKTYPKSYV